MARSMPRPSLPTTIRSRGSFALFASAALGDSDSLVLMSNKTSLRIDSFVFTKESFELAKSRLNPGGVVTQWVPLYESNAETVKSEDIRQTLVDRGRLESRVEI